MFPFYHTISTQKNLTLSPTGSRPWSLASILIENEKLKLEIRELKFDLKQQKADSKKKIAELHAENIKLKNADISPVDLTKYRLR
jgi:regulator of replication initiation timing